MSAKILTVDDSKMVRVIVAKTFQPHGCEVYEASNGLDGLATAEAVQPHLIFLDITMADMNGLEVLDRLRKMPVLADTPVVMLTAESGLNSIEKADQLKVIGYVPKPFKGEKLLEIAAKVLQLDSTPSS